MISVVGLGPGARSYILPATIEAIKSADIVIGAERNLESIKEFCSTTMDLSEGFIFIGDYLVKNQDKNIAVVVSGDTGFYSMLSFVKRTVETDRINVIPGISSLQYMYGKLKRGYENAKWISLHGREADLESYLKNRTELGILTDQKQNSRYIGSVIKKLGLKGIKIYVGERLSYTNEKISCLTVDESLTYAADDLSVVVISYE